MTMARLWCRLYLIYPSRHARAIISLGYGRGHHFGAVQTMVQSSYGAAQTMVQRKLWCRADYGAVPSSSSLCQLHQKGLWTEFAVDQIYNTLGSRLVCALR